MTKSFEEMTSGLFKMVSKSYQPQALSMGSCCTIPEASDQAAVSAGQKTRQNHNQEQKVGNIYQGHKEEKIHGRENADYRQATQHGQPGFSEQRAETDRSFRRAEAAEPEEIQQQIAKQQQNSCEHRTASDG